MQSLLDLLKDGRSRPLESIAAELGTSTEDVRRKIEFLEQAGAIRRVSQDTTAASGACAGCSGCQHGKAGHGSGQPHCAGCMPEGGFKNMGVMWEVVG
jgi:hypothetical protein